MTNDSPFELNLTHKHLHYRRTKILATVGPASSSVEMLREMLRIGVDVFRINCSHGSEPEHVRTIKRIRKASRELGRSVAILADLCGPKIRVGCFPEGGVTLKEGARIWITAENVLGNEKLVPTQYANLIQEARPENRILLDDGNLELEVMRRCGKRLEAKVVRGGYLKDKKGMNLPDTAMSVSALTAKDRADVAWCVRAKVDYFALSFVRHQEDIAQLRALLDKKRADTPIVAKIEKPEALADIIGIVEKSDGIMVARGDLGVELPASKVPLIQNKLIAIANERNKPVIVATQMLESMIEHSRPTRAEVSDVAGACSAGADALMLSAETAAGRHPLEALRTMDTVLRETEAYQFFSQAGRFTRAGGDVNDDLEAAIGTAAAQLSRDLMVRALFVLTRSGFTARMISADRPAAPIFAFTRTQKLARTLNLMWGVYPHVVSKQMSRNDYLALGERLLKRDKLAEKGHYVLLIAVAGGKATGTNDIVVHRVR